MESAFTRFGPFLSGIYRKHPLLAPLTSCAFKSRLPSLSISPVPSGSQSHLLLHTSSRPTRRFVPIYRPERHHPIMSVTNGSGANGHATTRRPLPCGIYAPTMTFFDEETEDLDIPTIKKHAERLARAGLVGLVTMGSNGEAIHCTREEKVAVTKATREALDAAGFTNMPIIVGATEGSVKGTVELCKLSQEAGGDYVLLLPPS